MVGLTQATSRVRRAGFASGHDAAAVSAPMRRLARQFSNLSVSGSEGNVDESVGGELSQGRRVPEPSSARSVRSSRTELVGGSPAKVAPVQSARHGEAEGPRADADTVRRPMLFDGAPLRAGVCPARVYQRTDAKGVKGVMPVYRQCGKPCTRGGYCGMHGKSDGHGDWDPPGHQSWIAYVRQNPKKRQEALAEAAARAAAAATASDPAGEGGTASEPAGRARTQRQAKPDVGAQASLGTASVMGNVVAPASSVQVEEGLLARPVRATRACIVTGFGNERVEDVAADEASRVRAGARRGDTRRREGTRGRAVHFSSGQDLDRSDGGAWHTGRR